MKSENILYQDKLIFLIYNDKSVETKMITKFLSGQNCEYFLLSGKEYWEADTFLKDYIKENAIVEVKEKGFEHKEFLTPKELESFENQGTKYDVEKILYNKDQPIYSIGLEFNDDKPEKIIELKGLEQVEKIIGEKLDEKDKNDIRISAAQEKYNEGMKLAESEGVIEELEAKGYSRSEISFVLSEKYPEYFEGFDENIKHYYFDNEIGHYEFSDSSWYADWDYISDMSVDDSIAIDLLKNVSCEYTTLHNLDKWETEYVVSRHDFKPDISNNNFLYFLVDSEPNRSYGDNNRVTRMIYIGDKETAFKLVDVHRYNCSGSVLKTELNQDKARLEVSFSPEDNVYEREIKEKTLDVIFNGKDWKTDDSVFENDENFEEYEHEEGLEKSNENDDEYYDDCDDCE